MNWERWKTAQRRKTENGFCAAFENGQKSRCKNKHGDPLSYPVLIFDNGWRIYPGWT
jgi:hypothetical protein